MVTFCFHLGPFYVFKCQMNNEWLKNKDEEKHISHKKTLQSGSFVNNVIRFSTSFTNKYFIDKLST
jgi:hypothetical protein